MSQAVVVLLFARVCYVLAKIRRTNDRDVPFPSAVLSGAAFLAESGVLQGHAPVGTGAALPEAHASGVRCGVLGFPMDEVRFWGSRFDG